MMKTDHLPRLFSFLALLLALSIPGQAGAQGATDVLLRQQLIVSYRASPKLSFSGKYFFNLEDNFSRFDKSVLGLEMEYKISRWLETGLEYRYSMDYEQDEHEFRYFLEGAFSPRKKPYKIKLRTLVEHNMDYLDRDYLAGNSAGHTWRNRLIAGYELTKKWDGYVLFETYSALGKGPLLLEQANYGLGVDYQLKRRHSFNVEVQYRDYFLKKVNSDKVRVDIAYKISLGYQKPKKSKKGSKAVEEKLDE